MNCRLRISLCLVALAAVNLVADCLTLTTPSHHRLGSPGPRGASVELFAAPSSSQPAPPAITIRNLSCTHDGGQTWQLKEVSHVLARGQKAALVGRNGTGKSTLLKIIAECTAVDGSALIDTSNQGMKYTGEVSAPKDVRVAYVEQEPPSPSDVTVSDALLGIRSTGSSDFGSGKKSVFQIVRRYRWAVQNIDQDPDAFVQASADMDTASGWDVMTKAEEVATKLRVNHLQDQPLSTLSGGERKRVALAAALTQEPDVILLDEPTNFLSLAGVQWLGDLLKSNPKITILMVTHDRAFLDEVCDSVLELDYGSLYMHQGNYASYLEGKAERIAAEDAAVQAAKAKYKVELEWMRRQPQARESKQKARIEAFYKLEKATKPKPRDPTLSIQTGDKMRLGSKILTMRGVSFSFGDRLMLNDFSYDFLKGDRICLAGANGVGKSTFLKILTGELEPTSGTIDRGDTLSIGVYDQNGLQLDDPEITLLEFVVEQVQLRDSNTGRAEGQAEARRLLRQFEFSRQRWNQRVSVLSGGERRRLQMLSVFSQRPNCLLMDEPSVDCDLDTLSALEAYLRESYDGVLIVVSHDRAFADKVADHLFVFEGQGEVKDFQGVLSEYASTLVEMETQKIDSSLSSGEREGSKSLDYKEERARRNEERNKVRRAKKDMTNLETAIERLRTKASGIQNEIDQSADEGWTVLAELTAKLDAVNEEIDEKEMRWMEAAEIVEQSAVEV